MGLEVPGGKLGTQGVLGDTREKSFGLDPFIKKRRPQAGSDESLLYDPRIKAPLQGPASAERYGRI